MFVAFFDPPMHPEADNDTNRRRLLQSLYILLPRARCLPYCTAMGALDRR
jgi:hypothetical protein